MRLLLQLVALWAVLAIGLGLVGERWIDSVWRSEAESSFRRDVVAALAMSSALEWSSPPEGQAAWKQMEQDLELGITPVESREATTGRPQQVRWTSAGRSGARITTEVHVADPTHFARASALRITRSVPPSPLDGLWWKLWGLLNGVAVLIGAVTYWSVRGERVRKRRLLRPWLQALDEPEPSVALLPAVEAQDSDFCLQMDAVADSVNRIYSELKTANERSELVLGNLREGVLAVDDRSRVLLANKALRRLLDLPNDNLLYRPLLELIRTPAIARLISAILNEQAVVEEQIEFGAEPSHLRILGRPLPLGEERTGALVTVRDETLIKRVDMIKKDFVSNASHELKTPLAAIRAYAETLQMGALDDREAAESFVKSIISQSDRLDGLVKGMLQLSRVEVGSALKCERFDAMEALEPCINAAHALAGAKGVAIRVDAPEHLVIHSDRDGFQTIASNLLSNGVRYTEDGGQVSVRVRHEDDMLVLRVQDTGIGMHEEDLERIFERFYRAMKDRSVDTGGTGLGLAIVKHLTSALGGTVRATSTIGEGSCFVVRLPMRLGRHSPNL